MIQQRVGDPTGQNIGGVWVSPMRDVAHCFPLLVRRAIEAATDNEIGDNAELSEEFGKYAVKVAKFIKGCTGEDSPNTVQELFDKTELLEAPAHIKALFEKWLTRVMLSMYFTSIKEATHPGEKPIGVNALLALVLPNDDKRATTST